MDFHTVSGYSTGHTGTNIAPSLSAWLLIEIRATGINMAARCSRVTDISMALSSFN